MLNYFSSSTLATILIFAGGVTTLVAPLLAPVVLAMFAALAVVHAYRHSHPVMHRIQDDALAILLLGFCVYALSSSIWALQANTAMAKGATVFTLVLATLITAGCVRYLSGSFVRELSGRVLRAGLYCAVLLAIDIALGLPVLRFFFELDPDLLPANLKGVHVVDGEIVTVLPFLVNRNIAVLGFLFWPLMLIALGHRTLHMRRISAAGTIVTVLAAVGMSANNSLQLALVFSVLAFALLYFWPSIGRMAVIAGWCAAVLLVVPASYLAYDAGLHKAEWLPDRSARARIYIWRATAEKVPENPLLGIGVRSTRGLEPPGGRSTNPYTKRTGWHAHNLYLQTWFELGAVGALMLLATGLMFLRRLGELEPRLQPYGHAAFVTVAVAVAFGWGMWQTWLWGAVGLTVCAFILGLRYVRLEE